MKKPFGPWLFALLVVVALFLVYVSDRPSSVSVSSFDECVDAGFPVMESYPRQCRDGAGHLFVEEVDTPTSLITHMCTLEEKQAGVCTLEYAPVCGLVDNGVRCITAPCASTDAVTYSNGCSACAAQAVEYYQGSCDEQQFVVCADTVTGFSPVEYAESIGGVCVDVCPGNYDSFVTQIGVEVCIEHYGVEDIEQWQTCTKSTDSCSCVKASETTANEPISNAQYRCVPELYEQRFLFRSGLDRLDEFGRASVDIA